MNEVRGDEASGASGAFGRGVGMSASAVASYVRGGRLADLDSVAPIFDAYRQFYGAASDLAGAHRFLRTRFERDESTLLLAIARSDVADGELERNTGTSKNIAAEDVVGFVQLFWSFSSVSLGNIAVLNDLFVTPTHRGRGIAAMLVDAAVAHARWSGAIRLELATQRSNDTALRLYRAKDFVVDTEFVHLSRALVD